MSAENSFLPTRKRQGSFTLAVAFLLFALGACILIAWHHSNWYPQFHTALVAMAYNTAICMMLLSAALFALTYQLPWLLRSCALLLIAISGLTLLEFLSDFSININYVFMQMLPSIPANSILMSPTTATCLAILSCTLLIISLPKQQISDGLVIGVVLLDLVSLVIAVTALIGHGVGLIPAFMWLGISMAPQTALGLILFSITLLIEIKEDALAAFNRLSFFNRMISGFGLMALLVIAIGLVAYIQIDSASAITHELYKKPLQINNAASRIKAYINDANRTLKNIAVTPSNSDPQTIPEALAATEKNIANELNLISSLDDSFNDKTKALMEKYRIWQAYAMNSYQLLGKHEYDEYSQRTLHQGQDQTFQLEEMTNKIAEQAQQQIKMLTQTASRSETEAKGLLFVIVTSFLTVGLTVSWLITRSLSQQLQQLRTTMLNIANEQTNQNIPFLSSQEEIGDMARALEVFAHNFTEKRLLEARLAQLIEVMPIGVIMVSREGVIEIVNTLAEKIFQYDRQQLLGKKIEMLVPRKFAHVHPEHRESFFENPSPRSMGAGRELFGIRKDGSEVPLEIALAPVATREGLKILASIVDITERKRADEALNESRERLELTTRVNSIGIWEYDAENQKLIWDDTMFMLHGRNKEFFSHDLNAWKKIIHPDDLEQVLGLLQDSIDNITPFICKFRIVKPDGTIHFMQASAKVEHTSKNTLRVLGTNIDVTREEQTNAKLYELETLRSAIVEFSEDAIISKTPEGVITSWNAGAYNMFGYTAEEAIGKPIKDLVFPKDLAFQEEMLLAQVRSGVPVKHFETVRSCKDGQLINVSITLSPIKNAHGEVVGISAIKRDITDTIETAKMLSQRQQELEQSNRELERSNKELETFAYVASHDLKSPLRGVAQLSTWIEEDLAAKEYESVTSHTSMLRNRIQRMEKLLDDLLIFYRAGKNEGVLTEVDTNQMVTELFEIQNNKPGLRLTVENQLPTFTTLSTPLEQIIRNLLSNAIKHHDLEQGVISISSRQLNNQFIEFSVSDDGPGIPPAFHERIFGMFQTLKPRDELEGSGMGLALIKKLLENYGGKITVNSNGRGSCFSFTWPINIQRNKSHD